MTRIKLFQTGNNISVIRIYYRSYAARPFTTAAPAKVAPIKEEIDWQAKTDAQVWGSKVPGAIH